ncbi:Oligomycin resistance ATP-dependent permease YOR1 [Yarrowia sp. B02]|nr:Oligomycin resistance ATP-dependent permease YOR1 [Yarrowia sp. B02]
MRNFRLLSPLVGTKVPPLRDDSEREDFPEEKAGWYAKATWSWLNPLMKVGYLRPVNQEDLWNITGSYRAEEMTDKFQANLERIVAKHVEKYKAKKLKEDPSFSEADFVFDPLDPEQVPKYAIIFALLATFRFRFWWSAICKIIFDCAQTLNPLVSRQLISFVGDRYTHAPPGIGRGVGLAIGVTLMIAVASYFMNMMLYYSMMMGAQCRAVLSHSIYKKSLNLSAKSRLKYTNGQITNLLGTDCHKVDFCLGFFHFSWTFPVSMAIAIVILIVNLGPAALVGIAVIILCIFAVARISRTIMKQRRAVTALTDKRISMMKEILQSMRVIKFYAWELPYKERVMEVRKEELKGVKKLLVIRNALNAIFVGVPTIASMLSFVVMYKTGRNLDAAKVFSSLSLFNLLRMPLMLLPLSTSTSIDAFVALKRIQGFLFAPEQVNYVITDPSIAEKGDAIVVDNGSFIWKEDTEEGEAEEKKEVAESPAAEPRDSETTAEDSRDVESSSDGSSSSEAIHFSGLDDINLAVKSGEFIVITGAVGTGKSSLLSAIAGLMVKTAGSVTVSGEMIFSPSPWVHNATIRENILFGQPYDEELYRKVIHCCALERDFEILPGGDATEVGERGITLSGGQKARISLATMAYRNPQIILLDDVLSAVDSHVGKHIMEKCILGHMGERTRLLATHQLGLIDQADRIIFLDGSGSIKVGSRDFLLKNEPGFAHLMEFGSKQEEEEEEVAPYDVVEEDEVVVEGHVMDQKKSHVTVTDAPHDLEKALEGHEEQEKSRDLIQSHDNSRDVEEMISASRDFRDDSSESVLDELVRATTNSSLAEKENKTTVSTVTQIKEETDKEKDGKLITAEGRSVKAVPLKVYLTYIKYGGGMIGYAVLPIFLTLLIVSVFVMLFTNVWLSYWTENKWPQYGDGLYIGIFVMFGILTCILFFLCFYTLTTIGNNATAKMHIEAVDGILHAPMSFFDTTPLGRIMNRFSKDTDTMDNEISDQTRLFLLTLSQIIGIMILCIIYLPWFAIAVGPLLFIYHCISSYYRSTAREVKRLDSINRSHVFSHMQESLTGVFNIAAYGNKTSFVKKNEWAIDNMNAAYFLTIANQRWLAFRVDLVGFSLCFVIAMLSVTGQFSISPSAAGLVLSYILQIVGMMTLMVRESAQVENNMNTVERVFQYSYDVPSEAPSHIPETSPPEEWPQGGGIVFDDVSMSYRPGLPLVLKDISVNVLPGEHVGICGRTGAGKSSIMNALYRLSELANGSVHIDNVDISQIGLNDLRSKLSIIPQDPVLFNGTIRSNIDPFGQRDDAALWDALRRSWLVEEGDLGKLKAGVTDSNHVKFHLDTQVDEDGSNFSLGERQLLALARALVRMSRILILDEATSSVDYETDAKIQSTIVQEFAQCTILCIAHRLRTILNYDKIMVLDAGRIVEYDTPYRLYVKEGGVFRGMCLQSGITEEDFPEEKRVV